MNTTPNQLDVTAQPWKVAETNRVMISCLTPQQLQRLMILIDTPNNGYEKLAGELAWMIDNGASKNMAGDLNLLKGSEGTDTIVIDLRNGDQMMATKQGLVTLGNMDLSKGLYVPKLSSNLISIVKVNKELNCTVAFFDDFCVL